jgi:hypothetical protein
MARLVPGWRLGKAATQGGRSRGWTELTLVGDST